MKIFLSYASEDREEATRIELPLRAQGHSVFFDRTALPAGEEYDMRIRRSIEEADLFVFLITEHALDRGSYTLTELEIAGKTWDHPTGRLLPVLLSAVPLNHIPPLLKSVTLLDPQGNAPASIADAVYRIATSHRRRWLIKVAGVSAVAAAIAIVAFALWLKEPAQHVTGRDGAPAALVAAGTFTMGDDEESPRRDIYVDSFYLDAQEVTASRYRKFLEATGSMRPPEDWEEVDFDKGADLPVIGVDWNDAVAYCKWAGKRLPSEAEWEKAARGSDARMYPWGNAPPTREQANFLNNAKGAYRGGLTTVGTHPSGASPYGVQDLAGNASEWVADWYNRGFRAADVRNPQGPDRGEGKVIRGGGWRDPAERITATKRFYANPENRADDIGFRCARSQ